MTRITAMTPIENSAIEPDLARKIFEQINRFAGYGFNKSHAAAYAAIAFQTAWLKTHHPEAFFAAAMNLDLGEVSKLAAFADQLKTRGIHLWKPSINSSHALFTPLKFTKPHNGRQVGIAYGFSAIRGVGRSLAETITLERRRGGAFKSVQDFRARLDGQVNKTAVVALAKSGAFDCLGLSRSEALGQADTVERRPTTGQISMFDMMDAAPVYEVPDLDRDQILDNEFDVLGHFMTDHPLSPLSDHLIENNLYFSNFVLREDSQIRRASMAAIITDVDVRRTRSGDTMAVLQLSDPEGSYEAVVFGKTWPNIKPMATIKARVAIETQVSSRDGERRLSIDSISSLKTMLTKAAA